MSTPFLGQIQVFPFGFAPKGWAVCNGQLLPINQNQPLFALLGIAYGGDGIRTFGLPNLQGVFAMGSGPAASIGQRGGEPFHTLSAAEIPPHNHTLVASSGTPSSSTPVNNFPAVDANAKLYNSPATTTLSPGSSPNAGGQPHENRPPYLVLNVCIALTGIFPSRN